MRRLVAGLALALLVVSPVSADHAGIGWRTGDIRLETNLFGTSMEADLRAAVAAWNESAYIEMTVSVARKGSTRLNGLDYPCDQRARVVTVCGLRGSGAFAILDYGPRYLSDVFIGTPLPAPGDILIGGRAMLCHEIGHSLGLFHSADPDSCLTSGSGSDHPSAHDYDALAALYGP